MTNFRNYRALTNMALTGSNMAIGLSHLSFEIQSWFQKLDLLLRPTRQNPKNVRTLSN